MRDGSGEVTCGGSDEITRGGSREIRDKVNALLAEGHMIWETNKLPPLPDSERLVVTDAAIAAYRGENAVHLAAACQSFWLFRKLHEMVDEYPVYATLLGDYFFSVFSKSLIPLDSVKLNDEFAQVLAKDTQARVSMDDYLDFVRKLPAVLES